MEFGWVGSESILTLFFDKTARTSVKRQEQTGINLSIMAFIGFLIQLMLVTVASFGATESSSWVFGSV